jgi:hypothetical protein
MQRYRHARRRQAGATTILPHVAFDLAVAAISAFLLFAALLILGVLSLPL